MTTTLVPVPAPPQQPRRAAVSAWKGLRAAGMALGAIVLTSVVTAVGQALSDTTTVTTILGPLIKDFPWVALAVPVLVMLGEAARNWKKQGSAPPAVVVAVAPPPTTSSAAVEVVGREFLQPRIDAPALTSRVAPPEGFFSAFEPATPEERAVFLVEFEAHKAAGMSLSDARKFALWKVREERMKGAAR